MTAPDARGDRHAELPAPRAGNLLTVAIATFNGRELLDGLLPSLARQSFRDFRVLIVDDGSSDGTAEWLAEHWPAVELLSQPNAGVTRALNACLRGARDTELVGLFNNDIELDRECLAELTAALREHPQAGSATPKLRDFHRRELLDGAGDVFSWAGHGHRRGHGERDRGQFDTPEPIFGACGGAAVYRRAALDAVGDLDEDFYTFFEDVDWALRAQLAGFQCRYVPTAVAYHMGSATLGAGLSDFTRYQLWRNAVWVMAKGMPASLLLRHCPRLLTGQLVNLAVALRDRKLAIWLRAWRDAIGGLPRMLARRRMIQHNRAVNPRVLAARIQPPRRASSARPPAR